MTAFKRFAHLTIKDLPRSARLVVVAGPNGQGKSSLFEAFHVWSRHYGGRGWYDDASYYGRSRSTIDRTGEITGRSEQLTPLPRSFQITFHDVDLPSPNSLAAKKAFYVRSAHRNDPDLAVPGLARLGSALDEDRIQRLVETDSTVSRNYQRLVSDAFEDAFEPGRSEMKLGDWRDQITRDIRNAMRRLFPHLVLDGLGSPLRDPTFRFTKGDQSGFMYKNLSGGEKAALDLLLDIVVKRREYDDTVFCIDEPEAHLNPRVHGLLLEELTNLVPARGQLWVATHSIGMMRAARNMEAENPGSVVFLDFEGPDFDQPVILTPVRPSRTLWARALKVALADMAELVAPSELVVCEGNPAGAVAGKNSDHDARCYRIIFGDHMPDAEFVSGGGSNDVSRDRWGIAGAFPAVVKGTTVRRLIDRDDHAPDEVNELAHQGITVLGRRNLEAYLYDDDVLRALCSRHEKSNQAESLLMAKAEALRQSAGRKNAADDLKPAAPDIYRAAKQLLSLTGVGSDHRAFERNSLAPLLTPGMAVFEELKRDVFGRSPRS